MVECPFCYYYINAMKIPVSFMLRMFGDKIRGRSTRARSEIYLFKDPVIPVQFRAGREQGGANPAIAPMH